MIAQGGGDCGLVGGGRLAGKELERVLTGGADGLMQDIAGPVTEGLLQVCWDGVLFGADSRNRDGSDDEATLGDGVGIVGGD